MNQIKVTVQKVVFVQGGDVAVETGIKQGWRTEGVVVGGGNGTYVTVTPNKIVVTGKVEEEDMEFNVLYPLRQALGVQRLVKLKRDKLLTKFPKNLTFIKGQRGFWDLSESSAHEWLTIAGLQPVSRDG